MEKMNGVILFAGLLAVIIAAVIVFYILREKKKKKDIKKKFRKFSETYQLSQKDLRAVPRVTIPADMEIILTLTDDAYFGLKAHALDISLSGFSVKPGFPLKKLPINILINNVLVKTPTDTFVIRTMRTIRIEHELDKRLLAFHIEEIDGDQFDKLRTFMTYLDNFLKDEEENN